MTDVLYSKLQTYAQRQVPLQLLTNNFICFCFQGNPRQGQDKACWRAERSSEARYEGRLGAHSYGSCWCLGDYHLGLESRRLPIVILFENYSREYNEPFQPSSKRRRSQFDGMFIYYSTNCELTSIILYCLMGHTYVLSNLIPLFLKINQMYMLQKNLYILFNTHYFVYYTIFVQNYLSMHRYILYSCILKCWYVRDKGFTNRFRLPYNGLSRIGVCVYGGRFISVITLTIWSPCMYNEGWVQWSYFG